MGGSTVQIKKIHMGPDSLRSGVIVSLLAAVVGCPLLVGVNILYPTYTAIIVGLSNVVCAIFFLIYDHALRAQLTRENDLLRAMHRTVGWVSHEMRNPLSAVRLGLQALESQFDDEILKLHSLREDVEAMHSRDGDCEPGTVTVALEAFTIHVTEAVEDLAKWKKLLKTIQLSSENAIEILDDLLQDDNDSRVKFSGERSGTKALPDQTFHIRPVAALPWETVETNVGAFQLQAQQKGIQMHLRGPMMDKLEIATKQAHKTYFAMIDPLRISQVIRNLLSNALKFTSENGIIDITVSLVSNGLPNATIQGVSSSLEDAIHEPRAGSLRVAVSDTGPGLSADQIAQIFSEGLQFDADRLQAGGGHGLGLFISRAIMLQHGGTLSVTSAGLGQGATFALEIPLFRTTRSRSDSESATGTAVGTASGISELASLTGRSIRWTRSGASSVGSTSTAPNVRTVKEHMKHVLIVDDSSVNRKMMIRFLTAKGYQCAEACNGQEALDVYRAKIDGDGKNQIDAVLTDYEMPVMNGPTLVRNLRNLGCSSFIVGITGNLLPQDVDHFRNQGAHEVLGKPFDYETFQSLFQQHLAAGASLSSPAASAAAAAAAAARGAIHTRSCIRAGDVIVAGDIESNVRGNERNRSGSSLAGSREDKGLPRPTALAMAAMAAMSVIAPVPSTNTNTNSDTRMDSWQMINTNKIYPAILDGVNEVD